MLRRQVARPRPDRTDCAVLVDPKPIWPVPTLVAIRGQGADVRGMLSARVDPIAGDVPEGDSLQARAASVFATQLATGIRNPPPGTASYLTNPVINALNTPVDQAWAELDAAVEAAAEVPARVPLRELSPQMLGLLLRHRSDLAPRGQASSWDRMIHIARHAVCQESWSLKAVTRSAVQGCLRRIAGGAWRAGHQSRATGATPARSRWPQ